MKLFSDSPSPPLRSAEPDGHARASLDWLSDRTSGAEKHTNPPDPLPHWDAPAGAPVEAGLPDLVEDPFTEDPFSVPSLITTGHRLTGVPSHDGHLELVKGVLWHACLVTVDELFEDLATHPEGVKPGQWADCLALSGLPPRCSDHLNGIFIRRFLTTMVEVVHCLTTGWRPPPTVAHALALRLLLDKTGELAEVFEIEPPGRWRAELEDVLDGGIDTDMLYAPGVELPQSLAFPAWFTPRNPHEPLPPFIWP